ncbi:S-layer homology domain-containing protein [Candidatus Peregrinibacteria bacterium]|nr:MAG: S-layer homology domain-containing protein [Candidatus Peregrinibacteria bacterium]
MKLFSKITIVLVVLMILPISLVQAASFTDVPSSHPNYQAITYLQDQGVVEGYDDGTFQPNRQVNRAEALKIILLASDIFVPEISEQAIFPDVPHDVWYGKYALKAKNLSIVQGMVIPVIFVRAIPLIWRKF